MLPTRRTQPHRKGARRPSAALRAMTAGKPAFMPNPQDVKRAAALMAASDRKKRRPPRRLGQMPRPGVGPKVSRLPNRSTRLH